MWRNRVVLLTLTLTLNLTLTLFSSYSYFVHSYDRLRHIILILAINDIDSNLLSSILKFADDTKLFGKVKKEEDTRILQADLNPLMDWSEKWQMPFNASKCKVMHLGHRNNHSEYYLGNHRLESVSEEKNFGI